MCVVLDFQMSYHIIAIPMLAVITPTGNILGNRLSTRAHPQKWTLCINWTQVCMQAGTHMGRVLLRWRPIRV